MTEIQRITLRDVFRQHGMPESRIHDVMLLLRFKPERVQLAFYYTAIGWTQEQAAREVGVSQRHIGRLVSEGCEDVKIYLRPICV